MSLPYLYEYPLWTVMVLLSVVFLIAVEVGFRLGRRRRRIDRESASKADGFGFASKSVSAMLTLLLAFTYGFVVSRHQARKDALVEEANAIGTASLQADLATGTEAGQELRGILLDYARTRVVTEEDRAAGLKLGALFERTEAAQDRIWPAAKRVVAAGDRGPFDAALVNSVTKVLDSHTSRREATNDRLPVAVLRLLLILSAIGFLFSSYDSGLADRFSRRQLTLFVLISAFVLMVMIDFDRPYNGMIRLSQDALQETIRQMESTLDGS